MPISVPTDITGCVLWLDADQITGLSDGDPVATWEDAAGSNDAAQGTAGARPSYQTGELNGMPVVRFDGGDFLNLTSSITSAPTTVFAVLKVNDTSVRTISCGDAGSLQYRLESDKQRLVKASVADMGFSSTGLDTTDFHSINYRYSSPNAAFRLDGVDNGTLSSAQTFIDPIKYIGCQGGTQEFFLGDIAELIVYNSALSDTDRGDVEDYLTAKWFGAPSGDIAGTAAIAFTASGTLTGTGALAGSASIVVSGTGALTGAGALAGSAGLVVSATGSLIGDGSLVGTASIVVSAAGALTGAGALIGSASIVVSASGTLINDTPGAMAGTATLVMSAAGSLTGAGALAGTAAVVISASGALTGAGALAGSAGLVVSAAGALTGTGALIGTASVVVSAVGAMTGAGALAGTAALVVTAVGSLTGTGALIGSASMVLSATGVLAEPPPEVGPAVQIVVTASDDTSIFVRARSDTAVALIARDDTSMTLPARV